MQYRQFQNPVEFLSVSECFLASDECINGLMLSIAKRLCLEERDDSVSAYLAAVTSDTSIRALALMTPPHKLQLLLVDETDRSAAALIADGLLTGNWSIPAVLSPQISGLVFAEEWCQRTGRRHRLGMRQGIYELRKVIFPPSPPPGHFRGATEADLGIVLEWAGSFHSDCNLLSARETSIAGAEGKVHSGDLFVWDNDGAKSMAARARATEHGQCVSYVYTPPAFRGRGYASATVAHLSQAILDSGKEFCMLYTDLSNPTSNSIYQRIGYRHRTDVVDVEFCDWSDRRMSAMASPSRLPVGG